MLELIPLCKVKVQLGPNLMVGDGPAGQRSIGEIVGATVEGERLNGTLAGASAADWIIRAADLGLIDVRMTLRTADGALIYVAYGGRLDLSPGQEGGFTAYVAPLFETGDPRYAWLNRIQAAGKGKLTVSAAGAQLDYEFYELR